MDGAINLRARIQYLLSLRGFELRKWKGSDRIVEGSIPQQLRDQQPSSVITYYKTSLGFLGWNGTPSQTYSASWFQQLARSEDSLNYVHVRNCKAVRHPWMAFPNHHHAKILLQRLWEERKGWDDVVSSTISETWERWNDEIGEFLRYPIPSSYFYKEAHIVDLLLHGFSDASETAYAGVVYLRGIG